jgi:hypothetical protein
MAQADDAVRPGELIVERPTLICFGFEWRVAGDANGNATAKVQYRPKGYAEWRDSLPLYRIGLGLNVPLAMICGNVRYEIPDAVAGSILDLEPGAEYEVRLELQDPDGVDGDAVKTLTMSTRPEPTVPADGDAEVRHVYPPDWKGRKEKPAYENIMHALNGFRPVCDCYQTIHPHVAKPGTIVKMHGGVHTYDNNNYWNGKPAPSYWLHGAITIVARGTAEKPIYIVPAGDGEVILDGDEAPTLFNLRSADYLHFEGLTIRNTDIAFHCGFQGLRGGGMKGLTVKNCVIQGVVYGVLGQDGGSQDFYIADNIFTGINPSDRLGRFGRSDAGYAVNIAGQGHVVCHNYAAHFWDGINVFTSSLSDPQYGQQSRSIDFYNNDIFNCSDQFIEADGGYANIRILRNRCFNCPSQPISTQPVHAGPVYWVRNVVWNACGGKMTMKKNDGAQVYLFLNNTSSTHMKMPPNAGKPPEKCTWIIANNLSIGPGGDQLPVVDYCAPPTREVHQVDFNAYNRASANAPGLIGKTTYQSLSELVDATGYEKHSLFVDGYNVFTRAPEPPHTKRNTPLVFPEGHDFTPAPGSEIIDAGVVLPGITDGFNGKAPDIGAYEAGQPLPVYGPRNSSFQEKLNTLRRGTTGVIENGSATSSGTPAEAGCP